MITAPDNNSVSSASSIQVLLVDDSPVITNLVKIILKKADPEGYDLTCVDTLEKALIVLGESKFDVILLDLGLPDSEGLATFNAINKAKGGSAIVVQSGNGDSDPVILKIKHEADDFIDKQRISLNTVTDAIRRAAKSALTKRHS